MPLQPKIKIEISRILVRTAMEDAAGYAARREVERQIRQQTKGTQLEGCLLNVSGAEQHITVTEWPDIPDSSDLTFTWTD